MNLRTLYAAAVLALTMLAGRVPARAQGNASAPKSSAPASAAPAPGSIEKRVEDFLRNYYAWGPTFELKVGTPTPSPVQNLLQVPVTVSAGGGSDSAIVYVSKDGRYMFRGDVQDLNVDPLSENRSKLHLDGYASKGPANSKVVLVEFGDFECPSCRQLDALLREILPQYPNARLVFKDFPLESIHPWAMTASLAGRCALQQGQDIFWKFHDQVYDNQDAVTPDNAFNKLAELAQAAGANPDTLKTCMADPKTAEPVKQSIAEARELQVNSTPTTFIDGRRMVGPDPNLLKQYLDYDTAAAAPAGATAGKAQ